MSGAEAAWASTLSFLPKLGMFLIILIVGYFVAKWLAKLTNMLLEKVHFDRAVERGGIKRVLEKTKFDASDIMAKIVFYAVFLLVLQFAFGVFGPNPVSDLLQRIILFLPTLFVALLIVVIASAIAKAAKDILTIALGNLSYGPFLAKLAGVAIVTIGVFAALSHLGIAPAIVNGLFYALLAIIAGSAIIAIGGGGIAPMRAQWEKAMRRMETEAPRLKGEAQKVGEVAGQKAETWVKSGEENAPRPIYTPKP
ncbi:MAG: hypothetical protein H0X66_02605 [Verrucomicrobia bacterium]|nr:hypothetical protein [Verrucomicrobiota bacterium]